jgi:transposase
MFYIQGKPLSPEVRKFIVSVKQYFDRNKADFGQTELSSQMTADALSIGVATVNRVIADYNKDPRLLDKVPQTRGRPCYSINASHETAVRNFIREANQQGRYITLDIIGDFLNKRDPDQSFHVVTLARTLDRWGFTFGKGTRSQHLKEKDYVIAARRRYLRKKISNRSLVEKGKTLRPEVYLDESYVNKNHSNDLIWYYGEDGPWVQKPTGKGERLIIMNAITINGWVPGAKLVFKSTKKTGDYHGQMNWELFRKWFTEMLIPNIPDNSLIIMDNASYHNTLSVNSAPLPTSSKAKIRAWLEANKILCQEDSLKAELVEILKKLAPEPIFAIDEIVQEFGHEVIRTPPYHPELQPIETCWGVVKNHVARTCDFTMHNLIEQLNRAFNKVTAHTCSEIIKEINKIEDKFWKEDLDADENE